jgi:hypothetical protein
LTWELKFLKEHSSEKGKYENEIAELDAKISEIEGKQ